MKPVMPELITVEELAFALKKTVKSIRSDQLGTLNASLPDAVFLAISDFCGVEKMLKSG